MKESLMYALYGTLTGVVGTGLGGVLAFTTSKNSPRFIASVLEYAAGLMLAITLLDLLPSAFQLASIYYVLVALIIGIALMSVAEYISNINAKKYTGNIKTKYDLRRSGIIMAIGIAMHNFPEGLAVGAGFDSDFVLGFSLAITILIHNIPEGLAMSIPMKLGSVPMHKVVLISMLSGVPMGIGALVGAFAGNVSQLVVAFCLALAAGSMLYIVLSDLIPQSKKLYTGKMSSIFNILGIITGVILSTQF